MLAAFDMDNGGFLNLLKEVLLFFLKEVVPNQLFAARKDIARRIKRGKKATSRPCRCDFQSQRRLDYRFHPFIGRGWFRLKASRFHLLAVDLPRRESNRIISKLAGIDSRRSIYLFVVFTRCRPGTLGCVGRLQVT